MKPKDSVLIDSTKLKIDAAKLKEARGDRSPAVVAETIGISRQHLWRIEEGKQKPGADVLAKLCWLYDLKISDITNGFSNGKRKAA